MATFTFRAQAALDLRRTQDEDARRQLAEAERVVRESATELEHAEAAVRDAIRLAGGCSADVTLLTWHRNWIASRQHHADQRRVELEARRAEAAVAAAKAQAARRQLRTLERLRDRALRAFLDAQRRNEQKALDALGTMQYAVRHIREEERL